LALADFAGLLRLRRRHGDCQRRLGGKQRGRRFLANVGDLGVLQRELDPRPPGGVERAIAERVLRRADIGLELGHGQAVELVVQRGFLVAGEGFHRGGDCVFVHAPSLVSKARRNRRFPC
jgi:hypothetical protein